VRARQCQRNHGSRIKIHRSAYDWRDGAGPVSQLYDAQSVRVWVLLNFCDLGDDDSWKALALSAAASATGAGAEQAFQPINNAHFIGS
jgi:hypothetical protein